MKRTIYILDDEPDILELVSVNLIKSGFNTKKFTDSKHFLDEIKFSLPDLIILDLMLPDADGFDICKYLRSSEDSSAIPIIMLTAKGDETDKIIGLELGADDYVTKPFSPKELVARVKAVLRRHTDSSSVTEKIIINDILVIDLKTYEVKVNNKLVSLTSTEFKILSKLSEKKGWVYSRNQLLDHLWSGEKYSIDRTIDVHIRHLREKLGEAGTFIKNIRGVGYKIE